MESDTPSYFVRRGAANNVCLAFSSRDTEKGKFTFYKILSEFPGTVIFVNDYSNNWYLGGTPDFLSEAHFLQRVSEDIYRLSSSCNVCTVGASMGGYAALKYGAIFNATHVLALGPECELAIPHGRSVESLPTAKEGDHPIYGLHYSNSQNVMIVSGSNDIVDTYCATKFKHYNAELNVKLIRNRTHVVAKYLDANFSLATIINQFFLRSDTSFATRFDGLEVPSLQEGLELKAVNEWHLSKKKGSLPEWKSKRQLCEKYPTWSLLKFLAGVHSRSGSDDVNAQRYLREAVAAQPSLGRARLLLANIFIAENKFAEAVEFLTMEPEIKRTAAVELALSTAMLGMNAVPTNS